MFKCYIMKVLFKLAKKQQKRTDLRDICFCTQRQRSNKGLFCKGYKICSALLWECGYGGTSGSRLLLLLCRLAIKPVSHYTLPMVSARGLTNVPPPCTTSTEWRTDRWACGVDELRWRVELNIGGRADVVYRQWKAQGRWWEEEKNALMTGTDTQIENAVEAILGDVELRSVMSSGCRE